MTDLAEDPLAPDWDAIARGDNAALSDALFLIWQRLSQIENTRIVQTGKWTPSDQSGAGLVFSVAVGTWIKIGALVILQFNITYPITASGASAAIGLFPYFTGNETNVFWGGFFSWVPNTANQISLNLNTNKVSFFLNQVACPNVNLSAKNVEGIIMYVANE